MLAPQRLLVSERQTLLERLCRRKIARNFPGPYFYSKFRKITFLIYPSINWLALHNLSFRSSHHIFHTFFWVICPPLFDDDRRSNCCALAAAGDVRFGDQVHSGCNFNCEFGRGRKLSRVRKGANQSKFAQACCAGKSLEELAHFWIVESWRDRIFFAGAGEFGILLWIG